MNNEDLIRELIKGSIQRAIRESTTALVVLVAFAVMLVQSEVGSPRYFGCLIILVGTGFIGGVVWSYALSSQLLRVHSPTDVGFWQEAFRAQAKLLRLVPLWYCAPIFAGGILVSAPTTRSEFVPFLVVAGCFVIVCAVIIWLNRRAAMAIEDSAKQLAIP